MYLEHTMIMDMLYVAGIEFSGIDGTFFKHVRFKKGVILLLVTRDGNNKLLVPAWVICLKEDSDNYLYMAHQAKKLTGLSTYLDRHRHVLYSDRHKGIPAFEREFSCGYANCMKHIIDNLRVHLKKIPKAAVGFHDDQVFRIQKCNTKQDFTKSLNSLRRGFPHAADYLDALPHHSTYLYAMLDNGLTTHGHKTSNVAEIVNNVISDVRFEHPYIFNDFLVKWHGEKFGERQDLIKEIQRREHLLTPYARRLLGKSEHKAREENLSVFDQGCNNYLVTHHKTVLGQEKTEERNMVNLMRKTCTCPFLGTHRIPCMHVIVVLDNLNLRSNPEKYQQFRRDWIAPYFWSENYIAGYQIWITLLLYLCYTFDILSLYFCCTFAILSLYFCCTFDILLLHICYTFSILVLNYRLRKYDSLSPGDGSPRGITFEGK